MNTFTKLILSIFALTNVGAKPLPPGEVLTEIDTPQVKPIKTGDNGLNCGDIFIHKKQPNIKIVSTLQPRQQPIYENFMPVTTLWFLPFYKVLNTPAELHIIDNDKVVKTITPNEFRLWMNSQYEDKYISVTFDLCISVDRLAGFITDDLKKHDLPEMQKMYKNISHTKDAFFCADQVVCIQNYCKNSIYNPSTQLCYYSSDKNNELVDYKFNVFQF